MNVLLAQSSLHGEYHKVDRPDNHVEVEHGRQCERPGEIPGTVIRPLGDVVARHQGEEEEAREEEAGETQIPVERVSLWVTLRLSRMLDRDEEC